MKKLTNTYFKKSKKSEKAKIMNKELTSQKLQFIAHIKKEKSLSERGLGNKSHKISRPFTKDIIEEAEKNPARDGNEKQSQNGLKKRATSSEARIAKIENDL